MGQNNLTSHLGTNQELLTLLIASKMVEFIMIIDRYEHVDMALTMTEMDNEREVIDEENDLQLHIIKLFEGIHASVELDGLECAMELELGVTIASPSKVEEESNPYMEPSVDHEGDELV